jgi:hypothetical protein
MRFLILALIFLSPINVWAEASRDFDGTDDEVDFGNNHSVTTGDVAFGGWIITDEDASFDCIISKKISTTANAGYSMSQNDTTDAWSLVIADGTDSAVAVGSADNDGVWTFITGYWDGATKTAYLYENAVNTASDTDALVGSISSASVLQVGESSDDLFDTNGRIAHVFVEKSTVMIARDFAEIMWKPDFMEMYDFYAPIWGDATELDLSAGVLTGTVTGTTANANGPPVMFGGGLPL